MVNIFRYAGLGMESIFGTAVEADFHVDQASCTLDPPDSPDVLIPSGMGRSPWRKYPDYYVSAGNLEYGFDIETIGWLLRYFLPGYAFTAGSGSPNIHELYGTDSVVLKSFTSRVGKDQFEHIFPGCMLNTLDLKVDGGMATATAGILGGPDSPTTLKTRGQLSLPTAYPLTTHDTSCFIDDEDESAEVQSVSVSLNNNLGRESARRLKSRYPQKGFRAGARVALFNASIWFEDRRHLEMFWGGPGGVSAGGAAEVPFSVRFDDKDEARYLVICSPRAYIQSVRTQARGSEGLVQEVVGRALTAQDVPLEDASTVDTDLLVTLLNNTATMAGS